MGQGRWKECVFCVALVFWLRCGVVAAASDIHPEEQQQWPTVWILMLARNKADVLPFSLTMLQNLDYPKDRMAIRIVSDHNEDETDDVVKTWVESWVAKGSYGSIQMLQHPDTDTSETRFPDQTKGPLEVT